MKKRPIISYTEATLEQLDAGSCIEYVGGKPHSQRYYAIPSFLIIGAAKCGTRELHTWLSKHPDLKAHPKEVNFFDEVVDLKKEWIRYVLNPYFLISKDREHAINSKKRTFEKTPAYFSHKNRDVPVPGLVRQVMPSGKFIAILRDPADRLYSNFQMNKRGTKIRPAWTRKQYDTFEDYLLSDSGKLNTTMGSVQVGCYATHLKTWLQYFDSSQILVITMDAFKESPFELMDRIQDFLAIEPFDYRPLVEQTDRGFWVICDEGSKAKNDPYEPMTPRARQLLNDYYEPFNEELRELFPETEFPWGKMRQK